jgi:hypothetical protein
MGIRDLIEMGRGIFRVLTGTSDSGYVPQNPRPPVIPNLAPAPPSAIKPVIPVPAAVTDRLLVRHTLFQLTTTSNAVLQAENRVLTPEQVGKLMAVDQLLAQAADLIGKNLVVNSGYRCPKLNDATPGHAVHSQHMLCEAADVHEDGSADTAAGVEDAFQKLWLAALRGKFKFGQMIVENAARSYGRAFWLHLSLGRPYRDPVRCGQVLRMKNGVYTLIATV